MRPTRALLLLLVLTLAACASHQPTTETVPKGGATLSVDNRSSFDVDIYVQRRSGSVRLGFAPAKETTRFALAPGLIAGSGIVQFSARPTRGGESSASDPFTVQPGEEITWVVPQ
jgi:hypothetical protein